MKKELLSSVGAVVVIAAVKEVAKIAWKHYKEKATEEEEEIIIVEESRWLHAPLWNSIKGGIYYE